VLRGGRFPGAAFETRRLEMDNGDFALFAWRDGEAFWMGNTETPRTLWQTDKYAFDEVPYPLARWAQRELLADLREEDPWLAEYRHVAWFFLPVCHSKDGRTSTRAFFAEHAAGFPDAGREEALAFVERILRTGVLDPYRETMAGKLGTSAGVDVGRMGAAIAEVIAAKLLHDAGSEFVPEVELDSGYALDFRAGDQLVEVTRPGPPTGRRAGTPAAAIRATADAKTDGQLGAHPDATLFVDCSSFRDDEWAAVRDGRPSVSHRPAVVYRARPDGRGRRPPDGRVEGYRHGDPPLSLSDAIRWV
jgi:hypothetical protein